MYKGEEREARMSFAKASVKRFNEDHNDAPAPNAYDAKMPAKKVSSVSLAKDNLQRFQEPKVVVIQDCCLVKMLLKSGCRSRPWSVPGPLKFHYGCKIQERRHVDAICILQVLSHQSFMRKPQSD